MEISQHYVLRYTPEAIQNLADIEKKVAQRIMKKLDFFIVAPDPLKFAKHLTNFEDGEYRFRIGDYRVIFDLGEDNEIYVLYILAVKHRKEAYN